MANECQPKDQILVVEVLWIGTRFGCTKKQRDTDLKQWKGGMLDALRQYIM